MASGIEPTISAEIAHDSLSVPRQVDENVVYTTGEAAKISNLSQQEIIRCFNQGHLKGFRVPGSTHRRIPHKNLVKFMKDNGIPMDALSITENKKSETGVHDETK